MDKFWDLLEQSVIVSGFVVVAVFGTVCYLAVTGQPIPEMMGDAALIIVGFFFGAKTQAVGAARVAARLLEDKEN